MSSTHRLATMIVAYVGSSLGHAGDFLEQPDWAARCKQHRTDSGGMSTTAMTALARHCAGYAACQAVAMTAVNTATGARVPARAIAASVAVQAVAHAVIDDGRLLARFATATGKAGFHDHAGAGCPGGSGRALMDQAAHTGPQYLLGLLAATAASATTDPAKRR